jgi:uncharacterized protein (DUF2132 family)
LIKGYIEVFMRRLMARYCEANNLALQERVKELEEEMLQIKKVAEEHMDGALKGLALQEIVTRVRDRLGW